MPKIAIKNTSKELQDFRGFTENTKKCCRGAMDCAQKSRKMMFYDFAEHYNKNAKKSVMRTNVKVMNSPNFVLIQQHHTQNL